MSPPGHDRGEARRRTGQAAGLSALLLLVGIAPVAGDIGSCGQPPEELDPHKFFSFKAQWDCARCAECGLGTRACDAACSFTTAPEFPSGCYPLVHDGEVCLHRLMEASCDEYRGYVADEGASTPTECNFCPLDEAP
ncbi:hypothetical protein SOCE26_047210 [Sorangium cellulosum]|uniref:Uncharacterized protein n=1 Tax=Sorangium cellulosum TaxID=56 RepID=A0A2L0EVF2_SORCE|nr:hypothetical protein [Sorangium cellulosum]AUX43277.1 hypothetical protein SOCE26_047210 [Sorangium cellulosum]